MWYDIIVPQQHAVEGPGGGDQFLSVLGEDHAVDELVDGGILDADEVARAHLVGGFRAPKFALFIAWRKRFGPRSDDDIVIPVSLAVHVRRLVGISQRDRHAKSLQRWLVKQQEALHVWISRRVEHFDGHGFAGLGVDELLITYFVASFAQQTSCFAQVGPHSFWIAVDWVFVFGSKDFGRHLVAYGLEDFEFETGRQSRRGKFGTFEIARNPMILVEENLLVHLLEIERQIERAAHPRVGKFASPGI